mmetsp:Transcript_89678/g.240586  ORF Transcript_89678/g.240586 Transcript_89678/m.240586 type:complete len:552 (-) Transcript_89678:14-1669(-)
MGRNLRGTAVAFRYWLTTRLRRNVPLVVLALVATAVTVIFLCSGSTSGEGAASDEVHPVMVSDCSDYQEWMTVVSLENWVRVKQTGMLTIIISCDDLERRAAFARGLAAYPFATTVLMEDLNTDKQTGDRYLCYNRPAAIRRWLASPEGPRDGWVLMIDADMLLLRPFPAEWKVAKRGGSATRMPLSAAPRGMVFSHRFNFLGKQWTHLKFDTAKLCNSVFGAREEPFRPAAFSQLRLCMDQLGRLSEDTVSEFFSAGVPHLTRAQDLRLISHTWFEFTRAIREQYQGWTAEMFSWICATAFVGMHHAYLHAEVATNPAPSKRLGAEGLELSWAGVDEGIQAGRDPCATLTPRVEEERGQQDVPTLIHYCESYNVSFSNATSDIMMREEQKYYFDKRDLHFGLKKLGMETNKTFAEMLDCAAPLIQPPPRDLLAQELADGRLATEERLRKARSAWTVCTIVPILNTALRTAKLRRCTAPNLQETLLSVPRGEFNMWKFKLDLPPTTSTKPRSTMNWQEVYNRTKSRLRAGNATRVAQLEAMAASWAAEDGG